MNAPLRLLGIAGSLRAASVNRAILLALRELAPARGLHLDIYQGLAELPHFNPDTSPLPAAVEQTRQQVAAADALVFACPEYIFNLPGAFKNLLDWLVGGPEMVEKPVLLINALPRSQRAPAMLAEILTVMNCRLLSEAGCTLPLTSNEHDAASLLADASVRPLLESSLQATAAALRTAPH